MCFIPENQEIQGKTLHSCGGWLWGRTPCLRHGWRGRGHRCFGPAEGLTVLVVAGGSSGQAVLLLLPSPAFVGKCQTFLWVKGNVPLWCIHLISRSCLWFRCPTAVGSPHQKPSRVKIPLLMYLKMLAWGIGKCCIPSYLKKEYFQMRPMNPRLKKKILGTKIQGSGCIVWRWDLPCALQWVEWLCFFK